MRDAFFEALTDLARDDERIWALTGDLGIGLFDDFERVAPGRYLNVGIAEQNLVGVAAGLAYAGQVPFAYSIAPFITSRPHDQIRVDVAMAEANVKLVGVGGGLSYGYLGPTHHAIEDLALMRVLPGMTVLAPADPADVQRATRAAFATRRSGLPAPRQERRAEPPARGRVVRRRPRHHAARRRRRDPGLDRRRSSARRWSPPTRSPPPGSTRPSCTTGRSSRSTRPRSPPPAHAPAPW